MRREAFVGHDDEKDDKKAMQEINRTFSTLLHGVLVCRHAAHDPLSLILTAHSRSSDTAIRQ